MPPFNSDKSIAPLRIGVDVGGTFTKAVAVEADPLNVAAQFITPTTHSAPEGVATGVVRALQGLLTDPAVAGRPIAVVVHSTTQAVNALLEGDVARVGIVGMGPARERRALVRLLAPGIIPLAPGCSLETIALWEDSPISMEDARLAVEALRDGGAGVIVASAMYSVDDPADEERVLRAAEAAGLPAVAGHQVTGLYGLQLRTNTAAINASILPRMMHTAEQVRLALIEAHLDAPLLVMRGDGGVTGIETLRARPIQTLFSGPAASVAGALLFGQVLDGLFIEVGGTSTNLTVIKGGRPALRYIQIMNHPLAIRALDVRVQGVAGGSLFRVRGRQIVEVGPRSAHIAGLPYLCFSEAKPPFTLRTFAPLPGDPDDYICLIDARGVRYALTVTCAACAAGQLGANGNRAAALAGFAALGVPAERALNVAAKSLIGAARTLAREYGLAVGYEVIGGGGGALALVPVVAAGLRTTFHIAPRAEVISSIGAALAAIREEVERSSVSTSASTDTVNIREEATQRAIANGAAPESIKIEEQSDPARGLVRVVATGTLALSANVQREPLTSDALRTLLSRTYGVPERRIAFGPRIGRFHVFTIQPRFVLRRAVLVVIDMQGVVQHTARGATIYEGTFAELRRHVTPDAEVTIVTGSDVQHSIPDLMHFADKMRFVDETQMIIIVERLAWF